MEAQLWGIVGRFGEMRWVVRVGLRIAMRRDGVGKREDGWMWRRNKAGEVVSVIEKIPATIHTHRHAVAEPEGSGEHGCEGVRDAGQTSTRPGYFRLLNTLLLMLTFQAPGLLLLTLV